MSDALAVFRRFSTELGEFCWSMLSDYRAVVEVFAGIALFSVLVVRTARHGV